MNKKIALTLLAASLLPAWASAAQEGRDYTVLSKPIPQLQANKIEVLEVFGYFCVHCYNLDPVLLKYARTLPADVYLRTEHVVWDPAHLGLARVAAAVNASGLKQEANPAVFQAVYEQKIDLGDSDTFKQWAKAQKSFDGNKLIAAYDTPENKLQAQRMDALTNQYNITSTPTVVVGGKYKVNFTGDWENDMNVVDDLINKVRTERQAKGKRKL